MNCVNIIGRLGRDPEVKTLPSGTVICEINVALTSKRKSKDGEIIEETCWIMVTFFGRTAEVVGEYFRKADRIAVTGKLVQETWEKDGKKNSKHKILGESFDFIESKGSQGQSQPASQPRSQAKYEPPKRPASKVERMDDDDVPF